MTSLNGASFSLKTGVRNSMTFAAVADMSVNKASELSSLPVRSICQSEVRRRTVFLKKLLIRSEVAAAPLGTRAHLYTTRSGIVRNVSLRETVKNYFAAVKAGGDLLRKP